MCLHANSNRCSDSLMKDWPLLERSALAEMPLVPIGWWTPGPSTTPASPGCFRSSVRVLEGGRKQGICKLYKRVLHEDWKADKTKQSQVSTQSKTKRAEGSEVKCWGRLVMDWECWWKVEKDAQVHVDIILISIIKKTNSYTAIPEKKVWNRLFMSIKTENAQNWLQRSGDEDEKESLDVCQLGASIIYKI